MSPCLIHAGIFDGLILCACNMAAMSSCDPALLCLVDTVVLQTPALLHVRLLIPPVEDKTVTTIESQI